MKVRQLTSFVAILLGFSALIDAQQTSDLNEVISRLVAYARDYRTKLPSLECDESILSQQVSGGKVKWEVNIQSTFRLIRDSTRLDDFTEGHTFKSVDGHPPKALFKLPYLIDGAFANGIGFAYNDARECYDFSLSREDGGATTRLEIAAKRASTGALAACKDVFEGYHKIVLIDAASGSVRHIIRSMSPKAARMRHEVVFAEIDYAPQVFGELTLWLPTRMESHDATGERRMTAIFRNYHRYTGEARVLPGIERLPTNVSNQYTH